MKIRDDKVIFSTGRVKYAHCGIVGIDQNHSVFEGYDGGFFSPKEDWESEEGYEGLTKDEQIELAEYMIARWERFKAEAI